MYIVSGLSSLYPPQKAVRACHTKYIQVILAHVITSSPGHAELWAFVILAVAIVGAAAYALREYRRSKQWGGELALSMLEEAGLTNVEAKRLDHDIQNA